MQIGIVCPYSYDVAGGVQWHVRDLAAYLLAAGHQASVLAPADLDADLPPFVVSSGRAVPVRYNGSVARVSFGILTNIRVGRWLNEHNFDVVHVHEPMAPSLSMLALRQSTAPVVATFHTATVRSRAMAAARPLLAEALERLSGRIAVSNVARSTVLRHIGGDAFVIPNGLHVRSFADATPEPSLRGSAKGPVLGFLGRYNEPRKGLPVLLQALPAIVARYPGLKLLIAGEGNKEEPRRMLEGGVARACVFMGSLTEAAKASFLKSIDFFVAPHTGGESFGIVLAEAMAAGTPVIASDLPAFREVLGIPSAGLLFDAGDPGSLSDALIGALSNRRQSRQLAVRAKARATAFDWNVVGPKIESVYRLARANPASTRPSSQDFPFVPTKVEIAESSWRPS